MPTEEGDRYAATYMPGAGRVLLRDKSIGRSFLVLLGALTLFTAAAAGATFLGALPGASLGVALFLTAISAFFALLATTLTVVRVVVSEREVFVQYGLW